MVGPCSLTRASTRRGQPGEGGEAVNPLSLQRRVLEDMVVGGASKVTLGRGRGRPPTRGKSRGNGRGARGRGQPPIRETSLPRAETPSKEVSEEEQVFPNVRQDTGSAEKEVQVFPDVQQDTGSAEKEVSEEEQVFPDVRQDTGSAEKEGEEACEEEDSGDESEEEGSSSSSRLLYLRGQASLPDVPTVLEQRPILRPQEDRAWIIIQGEGRPPNGILGRLLKANFPGMAKLPGPDHVEEPAYTWNHYKAKKDHSGSTFAELVKAAFWEFYRCEEGKEDVAERVLENCCKKLVPDMHYEARVQAVVTYYVGTQKMKMNKQKARKKKNITKEEYMKATPRWCIDKGQCWELMVDKWCSDAWKVKHKEWQDRQSSKERKSHHQGNRDLLAYAKTVEKRTGEPCSQYAAYNLSHIGKASVVGPYRANIPGSAYTSKTSYANKTEYDIKFREKYGPESDPSAHDLDPEVVMLAGEGKKHGRFAMGGSIISTASTPTLPRLKARRTSSSSAIKPRATPIQLEIEARLAEERQAADERLQQALAEAKRANDEQWEARLAVERQANAEKMNEMFAAYLSKQGLTLLDRQAASQLTPFIPSGSNGPSSSNTGVDNPLGSSPM